MQILKDFYNNNHISFDFCFTFILLAFTSYTHLILLDQTKFRNTPNFFLILCLCSSRWALLFSTRFFHSLLSSANHLHLPLLLIVLTSLSIPSNYYLIVINGAALISSLVLSMLVTFYNPVSQTFLGTDFANQILSVLFR